MTRRYAAAGMKLGTKLVLPLLILLVCGVPALAGPTAGDWEFHVFLAKASLDNKDPLALSLSGPGDFDGDGTVTNGTFSRSLRLEDDLYAGFRLGYMWEPRLETEVSYDRNHTGSAFEQTIQDLGSGTPAERVQGSLGTILTSYQVGVMYHPLAYWRTNWQPYAEVSVGWMDIDFVPSKSIAAELGKGMAEQFFNASLPRGDDGFLISYGVGVKYYVNESVALRADFRLKSYDLFEERRTDREISFGLSFFAPGNY